MTKVMVVAEIV